MPLRGSVRRAGAACPPAPGQCDLAKSLRRSCTATAVWELQPSHRGGLAARLVRSEYLDGLGHSVSRVSSQMSCAIRERCDWISPGKTRGDTESGNTHREVP